MDISKLKQIFRGEVTTNEADLETYSRDASIFRIVPSVIVSPKDSEDVRAVVKFVSEQKAQFPEASLTVRAGGTDMTGGSINDSIIVDVSKHLNRIGSVSETSVVTQPGVFFRDLEPKLLAKNVIMPAYPVSKAWCCVGGMVANNSGGEKTFEYGQVIKYVMELRVVLADGNEYTIKPLTEPELKAKMAQTNYEGQLYQEIFKLIQTNYRALQAAKPTTSKNASGYFLWDVWDGTTFDLTKLFVGSQGTLGIITDIKWKLVPLVRHRKLVVFYLNSLEGLGEIVTHINALKPESFEIFDKQTFKLALKYLPELIQKMQGGWLKMLWQFKPEIWLTLTSGLPEIVLLAEFTAESDSAALHKATDAATSVQDRFKIHTHITKHADEAQKYWTIRRESYNLLRKHNARKLSAPFIEDVIVHPDQLPQFMPQLNAIIAKYPDFVYTIAGHAGDANFHIIPLVDLSIPEHRTQLVQMSDEVFNLVLKFKGSMTGEHNDGLVRGPFLQHMYGDKIFELFKKTKQIFDPLNIFNPHKKTDATLDYYTNHLRVH